MAWNALAGQFRRRDEDSKRESELWGGRPSGGSAGVGGGEAPSIDPLGGFGGSGGSAGAPQSAAHVNYGTLYGANEEKAKQMASNVYRGAEKKAEDAKKTVADAQQTFQDKANANAGTWRPIQGAHGTRIESGTAPADEPVSNVTKTGGGKWVPDKVFGNDGLYTSSTSQDINESRGGDNMVFVPDNTGERKDSLTGEGTRGLARTGAGATNAGAARYASLYGQPTQVMGGWPGMVAGVKDYHHSVRPLDAKSGAGQDYTGPGSLKESMGDESYGKAAEDLKKAQDAVAGLQNSGGIAEALGYGKNTVEGDGMSAMDAGLTQTAGQSSFKDLARRYSNLGKTLTDAQTNSIAEAGRNDALSDTAASEWDALLSQYDADQKRDAPKGAITIGAANPTLGTNFLKGTYGYQLSSMGFDMTDYNNAGLTDDEKVLLAKENGGMLDELTSGVRQVGGMSDADWATWQSALAKLRAAKAKRTGGA